MAQIQWDTVQIHYDAEDGESLDLMSLESASVSALVHNEVGVDNGRINSDHGNDDETRSAGWERSSDNDSKDSDYLPSSQTEISMAEEMKALSEDKNGDTESLSGIMLEFCKDDDDRTVVENTTQVAATTAGEGVSAFPCFGKPGRSAFTVLAADGAELCAATRPFHGVIFECDKSQMGQIINREDYMKTSQNGMSEEQVIVSKPSRIGKFSVNPQYRKHLAIILFIARIATRKRNKKYALFQLRSVLTTFVVNKDHGTIRFVRAYANNDEKERFEELMGIIENEVADQINHTELKLWGVNETPLKITDFKLSALMSVAGDLAYVWLRYFCVIIDKAEDNNWGYEEVRHRAMNVASPKGDDVYKYGTSRRLLYVFMLTAFEPLPARYFWQRIKLYETLTYNHKFNQLIGETSEAFESFLRSIGEKEAVTRAVNKVLSGRETDKGCWRCGLDVEVEDIEEKTIICVYRLKQIMDGARAKMTHNKKRGDRKRKAEEVRQQQEQADMAADSADRSIDNREQGKDAIADGGSTSDLDKDIGVLDHGSNERDKHTNSVMQSGNGSEEGINTVIVAEVERTILAGRAMDDLGNIEFQRRIKELIQWTNKRLSVPDS